MYQHSEPQRSANPQGWRAIRHFAYLERAFRDVRRALAADPQQVIAGPGAAAGGAEAPVTELRVRRAGFDLTRDVRMTIGEIEIGMHSARLPLRWEDATHPQLFPILDAVLEIAPVHAGRRTMTQVGLLGHYRPPFGRLGGLADSLAGHGIAVESVEQFLGDLVERLGAGLPEPELAPEPEVDDEVPSHLRRRIVLAVDGLDRSPGGAAGRGLRVLGEAGVLDATVNPDTGLAVIDYDSSVTSASRLIKLLDPEE
ncbi:MAG TPA: heavy-metal-associated domain-containing protein [Acidimicrobiales bacterium]|nr:heavy-metal-associated domain-containing protein [Acidimicrobiales bacterium]